MLNETSTEEIKRLILEKSSNQERISTMFALFRNFAQSGFRCKERNRKYCTQAKLRFATAAQVQHYFIQSRKLCFAHTSNGREKRHRLIANRPLMIVVVFNIETIKTFRKEKRFRKKQQIDPIKSISTSSADSLQCRISDEHGMATTQPVVFEKYKFKKKRKKLYNLQKQFQILAARSMKFIDGLSLSLLTVIVFWCFEGSPDARNPISTSEKQLRRKTKIINFSKFKQVSWK